MSQTKLQTKTSHSVTVAASTMLATSSLALFLTLGMLAVAGLRQIMTRNQEFQISAVDAVDIDNADIQTLNHRIAEWFQLYGATDPQKKLAKEPELVSFLKARKTKILKLMETDPKQLPVLALPESIKTRITAHLGQYVEEKITRQGSLEAFHAHDGDTLRAEFALITSARQVFRLLIPPEMIPTAKATLEVEGIQLDANIAVTRAANIGPEPEGAERPYRLPPRTLGQIRTAVILFNFLDDRSEVITPDEARSIIFTNPANPANPQASSVKSWYQEVSNNQIDLVGSSLNPEGDVFGWVTVPRNKADLGRANYLLGLALAAAGLDENDYDVFVLLFPYTGFAESWALGRVAYSSLGSREYLPSEFRYIFRHAIHELGHVFSVNHAASYECIDANGRKVPISPICEVIEYFDPYDVMGGLLRFGNDLFTHHFNSAHKEALGYFADSQITTVTENRTYTLRAQQSAESTTRSLKIPRTYIDRDTVKDYYQLEYRPRYGIFDQFSNLGMGGPYDGISIRIAPVEPRFLHFEDSYLIDPTPLSDLQHSALIPGQTYTDPYSGVTFRTVSVTPTEAQVAITLSNGRNLPTLSVPASISSEYYFIQPDGRPRYEFRARPGQAAGYLYMIRNNDTPVHGPTTFTFQSVLPSVGWLQSPLSVTISPQESTRSAIVISSPADASDGIYNIPITLVGPEHAPVDAIPSPIYIIDETPPAITIDAPADGARFLVEGTQTFTAHASDASTVSFIFLYIDGQLVARCDDDAPTVSCSYQWNLSSAAAGRHTLRALAADKYYTLVSREIAVAVGDIDPPEMSNITAENITSVQAAVTWTTNESATSQVEYGITPSYGSVSALDANFTTAHQVTIMGLTPNTTYNYRVRSRDAAGNEATSQNQTFTTQPSTFRRGDTNADGILNISDPVFLLTFLFRPDAPEWTPPPCLDSADANDDGEVDISDAITSLLYMFGNITELPSPGAETPGPDPTPDILDCQFSPQ